MESQIIFGIDVSSKSSTVCVVNDRIKQGESFRISNDSFGYQKLYEQLNQYLITPLVVFEATGVYSLSLQAFLEDYHIMIDLKLLSMQYCYENMLLLQLIMKKLKEEFINII